MSAEICSDQTVDNCFSFLSLGYLLCVCVGEENNRREKGADKKEKSRRGKGAICKRVTAGGKRFRSIRPER
jgi:hypothetical protein